MKVQKSILSSIAALVLVLTPFVATVPAYAAGPTTTQPNFFAGLVSFLAQKLGLDNTKVQSAVADYTNQQKSIRQTNRQNQEKAHLDALVKNGTITGSQEQQILLELSKLHSEYNPANFKNLTAPERKQKFQQEQAEVQSWSASTGIAAKYLRPGFGMRWHMFNRWNNTAAPTAPATP